MEEKPMLMRAINEFNVTLNLLTTSPLLIIEPRYDHTVKEDIWKTKKEREGKPDRIPMSRASTDEIRDAVKDPDVIKALNDFGGKFFIPGSSIRGAIRSHLERSLRGLDAPSEARVCDPFADDGEYESCSHSLEHKPQPYARSCPVCRMFGSLGHGSRLAISDGERTRLGDEVYAKVIVERNHVQIDRRRGAVREKTAPLSFYGLENALFRFTIRVRNFELDHLYLLKVLMEDLVSGVVFLGSGKNKGYGRVKLSASRADLVSFGLRKPDNLLRGIGEYPDIQQSHGLTGYLDGRLPTLTGPDWKRESGWRWLRSFGPGPNDPNPILKVLDALKEPWEQRWPNTALLANRVPEEEKPACAQ
jgi:CRISPR/Cas system CSM-associated protein Csm3 (group 7 of RAMP superfamily)